MRVWPIPGVLHVEIRDSSGGVWRLATQDADWSPSDPGRLRGRSVQGAEVDEIGALRVKVSDGSPLDVVPARASYVTTRRAGS